jgi:hypothetical protein
VAKLEFIAGVALGGAAALACAFALRSIKWKPCGKEGASTMDGVSIFCGDPAAQAHFAPKYRGFLQEWVELQEAVKRVMLNRTINPPDVTPLNGLPDDAPLVLAAEDRFKADLSSFVMARTAVDEFSELLVLASNGYGIGAFKTLRGMYERIVTSAYVALYPEVSRALVDSTWTHQWKVWRRATALMPGLASNADEQDVEDAARAGQRSSGAPQRIVLQDLRTTHSGARVDEG